MKHLKSMLLVLALLTPLSALADKVTCESKKDALKECEMDTRGGVRMVKQLSRADCVEGHDWGVNRYSVWVKNGCRAEFETGGGSGYGGGYGGGSGNAGRGDWDRGCSDAKAGSYDRSGNASRAYEDGWQACKNQNRPSGNQGSAEVPSAAKSACLTAVNKNHGGAVVTLFVDSAEFSQANSVVIVNADGERWRCLVSNNGSRVEDLRRQY
jgi:hypothetical protein